MAIQNFLTLINRIQSKKPKGFNKLDFKNRPKESLAYLISRVFGPAPMMCALWLVTAVKSGVGLGKALWVYPLMFVLCLAIPIAITSYLVWTKKVKDIEWSDIQDRGKYLTPIVLLTIGVLLAITKFLTNESVFHLSLLFASIILVLILIYKFFALKVSAHITLATITFAAINLYLGTKFLWLFLLLIPIMWARYVLKVHTLKELVVGFITPAVIILLAVFLFGWPSVPK